MPHKDPEARRAYRRAYLAKNREHLNAWRREWERKRPTPRKVDVTKRRAIANRYYHKHKNEARAYQAEWRQRPESKILISKRMKRYRVKNPDWQYKSRFGINAEEYKRLIAMPCQICGLAKQTGKLMVIDHDHAKPRGQYRGVLCHGCNTKLGWLEKRYQMIAAYLGWFIDVTIDPKAPTSPFSKVFGG